MADVIAALHWGSTMSQTEEFGFSIQLENTLIPLCDHSQDKTF